MGDSCVDGEIKAFVLDESIEDEQGGVKMINNCGVGSDKSKCLADDGFAVDNTADGTGADGDVGGRLGAEGGNGCRS